MLQSTGSARSGATKPGGGAIVQSAHPRDIGALASRRRPVPHPLRRHRDAGVARPLTPARIAVDPERVGGVEVAAEPEGSGQFHRHEAVRPRHERPGAFERRRPPLPAAPTARTIGSPRAASDRRVRAGARRQLSEQQAVPVRVPEHEVAVGDGDRLEVGPRVVGRLGAGERRRQVRRRHRRRRRAGAPPGPARACTATVPSPRPPRRRCRIVSADSPSASRIAARRRTIASFEVRAGAGLMAHIIGY